MNFSADDTITLPPQSLLIGLRSNALASFTKHPPGVHGPGVGLSTVGNL